ncbi:MAG: nucleotidyl transferase AbiEii/AbiGii toxin family protein, partial [Limnobacter sp.]
ALAVIGQDLNAAKVQLQIMGYGADIRTTKAGDEVKLLVFDERAQVKVEVNFVFRGTLYPPVLSALSAKAQELFSLSVQLPTLEVAELYGSKLVAAMDRQHPRDIFDVLQMNEKFGIPQTFVDSFVAYLAGHNRPVHEVLFANALPMEAVFKSEFQGMTARAVELQKLIETRELLFEELPRKLTDNHKSFLLSLVQGSPKWDLMPFAHLQDLPALKWKCFNLAKLKNSNKLRFAQQYELLHKRLEAL